MLINDLQYVNKNRKDFYGTTQVPNLKVSLMKDNEIKHVFFLDTLKSYCHTYDTSIEEAACRGITGIVNEQDLNILLSQKYDKYIIEEENIYRNMQSGEDKIIYFPAQLYSDFHIGYEMDTSGSIVEWDFIFYNKNDKN